MRRRGVRLRLPALRDPERNPAGSAQGPSGRHGDRRLESLQAIAEAAQADHVTHAAVRNLVLDIRLSIPAPGTAAHSATISFNSLFHAGPVEISHHLLRPSASAAATSPIPARWQHNCKIQAASNVPACRNRVDDRDAPALGETTIRYEARVPKGPTQDRRHERNAPEPTRGSAPMLHTSVQEGSRVRGGGSNETWQHTQAPYVAGRATRHDLSADPHPGA
jgi:hypothetical protein